MRRCAPGRDPAAIADPQVNAKLTEFGVQPVGSTPKEYADLLQHESAVWQKLIRDLKISLD